MGAKRLRPRRRLKWPKIRLHIPSDDMDNFPHNCNRFAGNGLESDFKLTITYDSAFEVRVLFYYQLIPIQAVLQIE